MPPSIVNTVPVVYDERSEASSTTVEAISSTVAARWKGKGQEAKAPLPAPPAATAVLAIFERPLEIEDRADDDLAPLLIVGDRRLEPDLRFGDIARVYALWYEVDGASARLELSSRRWRIDETTVSLRRGKVETLRPLLRPLPSLKVELERPAAFSEAAARLLLLTPGASSLEPLAEALLLPPENLKVFPAIPPRKLEVELRIGSFSMRQEVDASDLLDHELVFRPQPIELHGQVFAGDTPQAGAEVIFHLNRLQALPEARQDRLVAKTDAEGRYQATLLAPGWVPITIVLPDRRSLPFQVFPRSYLAESGPLDFHLPANFFTVQVVDRQKGRGIPGAEVEIETAFGPDLSSVISTGDRTADDGKLELPPIAAGRLALRIRAARYQEATRTIEVSPQDRRQLLRIELEALPAGEEITLELADGRPAAAAEAALFSSTTDNSLPWWQGSADAQGKLELPPEKQGSFLLIRHPAAGALAIEATAATQTLRLPPRAPDLLLEVHDRAGAPAPTTALAFWLGSVEVAGRALSFLVGNPLPATDRAGIFRAAGLPATRLEVLAWAPALDQAAASGALSGMATPIHPAENQNRFELTRIE